MSVPRSALHSKVRKAVPDQRQSASYRFMPELRPVEFRLLSAAFLSGPTASWANGDTFCLCRPSCLRHVTIRKSPHFVCPADRFLPAQAVIHHFYKHPLIYGTILPFISVSGLPSLVIPCLPPRRFYQVRM